MTASRRFRPLALAAALVTACTAAAAPASDDAKPRPLKLEARDGRVIVDAPADRKRPWLGVLIRRTDAGIAITSVAKGSPADRADLKAGDVVTGIGGKPLGEDQGLLEGVEPGDLVSLDVLRGEDRVRVDVRVSGHPGRVEFENAEGLGSLEAPNAWLGQFPGMKGLEALGHLPCPPGRADCAGSGFLFQLAKGPRLGVVVEPLSEQLARYFGTEAGRGLLVKEVLAGSAAERAGVLAGDVLVRVAGQDIGALGDVQKALAGKEKGDLVVVEVLRRGEERTLDVTIDEVAKSGAFMDGAHRFHAHGMDADAVHRAVEEALAAVDHEAIARSVGEATSAIDAEAVREAVAAARQALAGDEMRRALEEAAAAREHAGEARAEADEARAEADEARAEADEAREQARRELEAAQERRAATSQAMEEMRLEELRAAERARAGEAARLDADERRAIELEAAREAEAALAREQEELDRAITPEGSFGR